MSFPKFRLVFALIPLGAVGLSSCFQGEAPPPAKTVATRSPSKSPTSPPKTTSARDSNDGNLLLGNPTSAAKSPDNYLLQRPQYSMSYNRSRGGSNWVSWHIDAQDLGSSGRSDKFRPDPDLPADWQIGPNDYRNSGYDRGHVCPSGDRTSSHEDNETTFYMSNMLPQTAELNREVWADFEEELRDIVRDGNEIYVVAGGSGTAGTIADGKVAVPQVCWKVALVLPVGETDLKRINAQTRVITVAMPNSKQKLKDDWRQYLVTTKSLSAATKLDFFSALPQSLQSALEAKKDAGN